MAWLLVVWESFAVTCNTTLCVQVFPELRFRYVEEDQPEEFFIPYVWTLVLKSLGLHWDSGKIKFTATWSIIISVFVTILQNHVENNDCISVNETICIKLKGEAGMVVP